MAKTFANLTTQIFSHCTSPHAPDRSAQRRRKPLSICYNGRLSRLATDWSFLVPGITRNRVGSCMNGRRNAGGRVLAPTSGPGKIPQPLPSPVSGLSLFARRSPSCRLETPVPIGPEFGLAAPPQSPSAWPLQLAPVVATLGSEEILSPSVSSSISPRMAK